MRKRLTDFRKEIVNLLDEKGIPLSVKNIHDFRKDADLSTVYRALEYLESIGSVKSITIPCTCGQLRYYHTRKRHMHFLHCEVCHNFFPVPYCGLKNDIEKEINTKFKFDVTGHTLFFFGKCKDCR